MTPQPLICVLDVQATSRWFQRTLGLHGAHGGPEYEQLTHDGKLVLQLHRWEAHEHPHLGDPAVKPYGNGCVLWFESARVEAVYEQARQAGAEILEPLKINPLAHHLEFWLREPNGYVVVVSSPYGDLGAQGHAAG